jgi:hypothetical protein
MIAGDGHLSISLDVEVGLNNILAVLCLLDSYLRTEDLLHGQLKNILEWCSATFDQWNRCPRQRIKNVANSNCNL